MNTKTDYELVANTRPESDDFTLPGCDPIGIWHLSRHGARYPDSADINEMNDILSKAKDQILSTGRNKALIFIFILNLSNLLFFQKDNKWLCEQDKMQLKNWNSRLRPEFDSLLTEKGFKEQQALGKRIQQRLPNLMKKIEHYIQVTVRTTNRERTKQSARSYLDGFLDYLRIKPNLTVNYGEDYLLKFPDHCSRYIAEVDDKKDAVCPEIKLFDKQSFAYFTDLETFRQRVNISTGFNNGKSSV